MFDLGVAFQDKPTTNGEDGAGPSHAGEEASRSTRKALKLAAKKASVHPDGKLAPKLCVLCTAMLASLPQYLLGQWRSWPVKVEFICTSVTMRNKHRVTILQNRLHA